MTASWGASPAGAYPQCHHRREPLTDGQALEAHRSYHRRNLRRDRRRRHPADWSRRTELVLPDEQAAEDPLIGVHNELRLARLARQKRLAAGSEEGR